MNGSGLGYQVAIDYLNGVTLPNPDLAYYLVKAKPGGANFEYVYPDFLLDHELPAVKSIQFAPEFKFTTNLELGANWTQELPAAASLDLDDELHRYDVEIYGRREGGSAIDLIHEKGIWVHNNGGSPAIVKETGIHVALNGEGFIVTYSIGASDRLEIDVDHVSGTNDFDLVVRVHVNRDVDWS